MPDVTVDVTFEERYWYPDDGAIIWLSGYQFVDPVTGAFVARDAPALAAARLRVSHVAGSARHHAAALQSDDAAPGRPLELRRDRANEHDANAIAVHIASGEQLGWVPRPDAEELAPELDRGGAWATVVLRELRASPRDPRAGLTMLLAPGDRIDLRLHDRRAPRRS